MSKLRRSMSGFLYLWHDRKYNKFYLGSHWGSSNDGYICSSKWMLRAYGHRPQDFKRRIIKVIASGRADLLAEEFRWLKMIKPNEIKVRYYNIRTASDKNLWYGNPDALLTTGQKISKALKGRKTGPRPPEVMAAISASRKRTYDKRRAETGSAMSDEVRKKCGAKNVGRPRAEEVKDRQREKMKELWVENRELMDARNQDIVCAHCGVVCKGRASQRFCSRRCRKNNNYHKHRLQAVGVPYEGCAC